MTGVVNVGVFIREHVWLSLFSSQTFSRINSPTFLNLVILHTYCPMKKEQSVPKRRHINYFITCFRNTTGSHNLKFTGNYKPDVLW
jgi:hypothetical protein